MPRRLGRKPDESNPLFPSDWQGEDSADESEAAIDEAVLPPENENESPEEKLGRETELAAKRALRQNTLLVKRGILGSTPGEVTQAHAIASLDDGYTNKAGKYLAIITRHQATAIRDDGLPILTDDPEAAARAISVEFGNYGHDALAEAHGLLELRGFLAKYTDLPPETPITDLQSMNEWTKDEWWRRSLVDLLRYVETLELINGGADHTADKYFASDPEAQERLKTFVGGLTLAEANKLISERQPQQAERLAFWIENLKDVLSGINGYTGNSPKFRAIVKRQLKRAGVREN